ncbi:dnaJ-like protein 60 isoform X1 [Pectinophora gossypiella]|uniref:dnaJ-like protein 60 isoform X1 n=1 Tax=Pectinophora gossypiella TaxID=13191 RepID=UPI00214E96CA|nr:dnaJ-like protein 60 isoform X1 [Pectinophora gossypiella]
MYNIMRRNVDITTINTVIRCYSLCRKSHYEILRLRKNCSDKEIKEAFIKLSKEYHPDKNKDVNAQQQFVQIVEAYSVLGKPGSRARYDSTIEVYTNPRYYRSYDSMYNNIRNSPPYSNYSYETYSKARPRQDKAEAKSSAYAARGLKKIPNYVLVLLCFGIAFVGTMLQAFVIRRKLRLLIPSAGSSHSPYIPNDRYEPPDTPDAPDPDDAGSIRQAIERSKYLAEELDKVRAAADGNSNEMQTRIILEKIVGSANPTIATASLGQALATEKK